MRHINVCTIVAMVGLSSPALAGPYSSGLANTNAGAVDPAIPGFTGPLGEGKAGSPNAVNPAFVGWASSCASYQPAPGVEPGWDSPGAALGPATGDNFDIVSLGDLDQDQIAAGVEPGKITLAFATGIGNSTGPDFTVFENAQGGANFVFAELAYVEASSDGQHFARFPSISLTPNAVGAYGSINPTDVHNLAGKHINAYGNSWGTPFDLSDLVNDPAVKAGQVNLHGVRYVRLIDIPGSGAFGDASDPPRPIYDAWVTTGSGGFDLEAIGVNKPWLGGDANLDGVVDISDLGILATNWQQSPRDFVQGDFDHNSAVDISDLGILATNWQAGASSLDQALAAMGLSNASVPEPTTIWAIAIFGGFAVRRHRARSQNSIV